MKNLKNENEMLVPCEIYSRVVGYYRPLNQWNKAKQEEFKERKTLILKGEFKPRNDI